MFLEKWFFEDTICKTWEKIRILKSEDVCMIVLEKNTFEIRLLKTIFNCPHLESKPPIILCM